jgi:hypothetical protein
MVQHTGEEAALRPRSVLLNCLDTDKHDFESCQEEKEHSLALFSSSSGKAL